MVVQGCHSYIYSWYFVCFNRNVFVSSSLKNAFFDLILKKLKENPFFFLVIKKLTKKAHRTSILLEDFDCMNL